MTCDVSINGACDSEIIYLSKRTDKQSTNLITIIYNSSKVIFTLNLS